jgi:phosphoglycolate phosphatase
LLIHFDYDGVLVDSFDQLLDLAQRTQREMGEGRVPKAEDLRTISNLTLRELGLAIGISADRSVEFAARMFHSLRQDSRIPAVQAGIPEILKELSRQHTLVVMTANSREVVRKGLRQSGLEPFIRTIYDGETSDSKAHKIQASMKTFGVSAGQTYMIGDALSDIIEGRKAGVRTIAVGWGFQPRERLIEGNPDYLVETPREILKIFA